MSDSDETVGPDSDVTLPPSDDDGRYTPDLFDDSPVRDEKKGKKHHMNTSHSKTHDLSNSESEDDTWEVKPKSREYTGNTNISSKSNQRSPTCVKQGNTSSPHRKPTKHEYSKEKNGSKQKTSPKSSHSKPTEYEHSEEKSGSKKKRFMDDFLNMTDSEGDSDLEFEQNQIKLKALKQKQLSREREVDTKTCYNDSNKLKGDSSCNKPTGEVKPHYLDKPHKRDYSKPIERSNAELKHSNAIGSYFKKCDKKDSPEYSPSSVKRKRSKSPVPQELRKAVTQILNENRSNSAKTKKPPCQYGQKCYRKNPTHFEEFSHPGDKDGSPSQKRIKLEPSSSSSLGSDSSMSHTPNTARKKTKPNSPLLTKASSNSPSLTKTSSNSPSLSKGTLNSPSVSKIGSNSPSVSKIGSNSPSVSKVKSVSPSTSNGMSRSTSASKVKSESPSTSKVKTHSPTSDCKVTRRPGLNPRTLTEKIEQAQPYSLFLTKVAGISDKYNNTYSMDIKDLLSPSMGNLEESCQFNFMFDIPWLMRQYPTQFRSKPLLIVHGEQGASKNALQGKGLPYENIKFCQAKLEMMYGTHHTKMMLLLYNDGLRVIIHTSNLVQQDWHQKTQGMWISPVFPKMSEASKDRGDSVTHFKKDLLDYMQAYKAYQLKEWIEHVTKHDMSSAKVFIIGSIPGRHVDRAKSLWGHMKLRKVLQEHGPSHDTVKAWPVIGQFSSIGSMGPNKDNWLCGEWKQSLATTKSSSGLSSNTRLLLIFPSRHNVRLSLEGYPAGGSIPYTAKSASKQLFLNDFFHVWKSEGRGRTRAMPHIKSYSRAMQDGSKAAWFVVTSSNLSKAAWGAFEKKGAQLMIRSYEIGVMFLPKFFTEGEVFPVTSDPEVAATSNRLLLPYDLPPTIYDKKDRPWMWDIPYMDLPDTNGNVWCPFSK